MTAVASDGPFMRVVLQAPLSAMSTLGEDMPPDDALASLDKITR